MSGARAVDRLRALGRAALLVLATLLPFERIDPLARLGPLQLSSVELFLYLALAAWGLSLAAGWVAGERDLAGHLWRRAPPAHRAVAAFALALFLSAALAPAARGAALKFALRSAGGMLLYAAAADLLRAPGAVARTAQALCGGALVAGLLAVAEAHAGGLGSLGRPFHSSTFKAFGQPRASGPFQYPNIAAMYLEAVAPLALAVGASAIAQRRAAGAAAAGGGWLVGLGLALLVLLDGVLATASRAGLVGGVAAVVAVVLYCVRRSDTRAPALAAIAAVLVVATLASGSALVGRFRFWKDGQWYRGVVAQAGGAEGRLPPVLAPSSEATESLDVQNQGALPWRQSPPAPVVLSYHWLDAATGRVVVFDGLRTALPQDIFSGGAARVRAVVRAPARPGRYVLWWDLVHEHTAWFSERGNPGLREEVIVSGRGKGQVVEAMARVPAPEPAFGAVVPPPASERMSRGALWRGAVAAWRAHPLLGIGPDNFRHLSRQFMGLAVTDERMHANSLYFETLADLGTLGMLAFLAVIATLVGAARRAVARPATRILALGVAAGLGTYLLHGALDYFLEFTPTYGLFWLLAGMIVAMERQEEVAA